MTDREVETGKDETSSRSRPGPAPEGLPAEVRDEARPACPACGGPLVERRGKLVCSRCHTICETCCEGGRGG